MFFIPVQFFLLVRFRHIEAGLDSLLFYSALHGISIDTLVVTSVSYLYHIDKTELLLHNRKRVPLVIEETIFPKYPTPLLKSVFEDTKLRFIDHNFLQFIHPHLQLHEFQSHVLLQNIRQ